MRAPQFGPGKVRPPRVPEKRDIFGKDVPPGPNPEAERGLRVKPFANIFALVEGLGVVSLHQTERQAKTAREGEIARRLSFNKLSSDRRAPAEADEAEDPEAQSEHRPG
jgi:hypothetical protein